MAAMNDKERLIKAMEDFGNGKFESIDPELFEDKELADVFNEMRSKVMDRNNYFLIRLNEAMKFVGESSWLSEMFGIIDNQTEYLKGIKEFYETVEKTVVGTDVKNANILAGIRTIENNIEPCVDGMEEIFGIIETLKGTDSFADENLDKLVRLLEFNKRTLNTMDFQVKDTLQQIVEIYEALVAQNEVTKPIIQNVRDLAETCSLLSIQCFNAGKRTHEISRNADLMRNHMFRKNSCLNVHDSLRIYEVDHLILSSRLYNHLAEYETLDISQVNNVDRCKFGLWINETSPEWIRSTPEFKKIVLTHEKFHKHAVNMFRANADSNRKAALSEYAEVRNAVSELHEDFENLHRAFIENGVSEDNVEVRVEEYIMGDRK